MATESKYQSLYFNPDADAEDKLVLHDPVFDDPTTGIMALKSARLEDLDGMVILGSPQTLRMFRERVRENDDDSDILKLLASYIKEMNLEVVYTQGKFAEIEKHLQPTEADSVALANKRLLKKPSLSNRPGNLNDLGKELWKNTIRDYQSLLKTIPQNRDKWDTAVNLVSEKSNDLRKPAFDTPPQSWNESVVEDIVDRDLKAQAETAHTVASLQKIGLLSVKTPTRKFYEVKRVNDGTWLTTLQKIGLPPKVLFADVAAHLKTRMGYRLLRTKQGVELVKLVSKGSSVTIKESDSSGVDILISHRLLEDELKELVGEAKKPEKELSKKWSLWVKSGKKNVLKASEGPSIPASVNWVRPSAEFIKSEWAELSGTDNFVVDEKVAAIKLGPFKAEVQKGQVMTLSAEEAIQLSSESGDGNVPDKSWILDQAKGPDYDFGEGPLEDDENEQMFRYSARHHKDLIPRMLNGESVDMPIVLTREEFPDELDRDAWWSQIQGKWIHAVGGRHRLMYAGVLGLKADILTVKHDDLLKAGTVSANAKGEGAATRDAFLYLEPKDPKNADQFAQCSTCWKWTGERCLELGTGVEVVAGGTCDVYAEGEPRLDLAGTETANFTPKEVGYFVGQVRCENCAAFDGKSTCLGFKALNEKLPDNLKMNPTVKAKGCCNAFSKKEAKAEATTFNNWYAPWFKPDHSEEEDEIDRVVEGSGGSLTKPELVEAIRSGKPMALTDDTWGRLRNSESWRTDQMLKVEKLAKKYGRDTKPIVEAYKRGSRMTCPIVLLPEGEDPYLLSGNTRLMVARAMGLRPKIWGVKIKNDVRKALARGSWKQDMDLKELLAYLSKAQGQPWDADWGPDTTATLEKVRIDSLKTGHAHNHPPSKEKEEKYLKRATDTMPPIVVDEENNIVDGHHRYRAAKRKGETEIMAYRVHPVFEGEEKAVAAKKPNAYDQAGFDEKHKGKRYRNQWVDEELKDEWLDAFNSLKPIQLDSICYGHDPKKSSHPSSESGTALLSLIVHLGNHPKNAKDGKAKGKMLEEQGTKLWKALKAVPSTKIEMYWGRLGGGGTHLNGKIFNEDWTEPYKEGKDWTSEVSLNVECTKSSVTQKKAVDAWFETILKVLKDHQKSFKV